MTSTTLLAVHLLATAAMAGVIWFVQVVHYPLFARVGPDGFAAYELAHQRRTSLVVGPLMAVEGVTALLLVPARPAGVGPAWPLAGLALLAVIHASTVFVQVPLHAALEGGWDLVRIRRLVRTNWVRTTGWTARAALAAAMVVAAR